MSSILKVSEIQDPTGKKILQNTGGVLQVVNNTHTTQISVSNSSLTDVGVSTSITPTSSSSKILVIASAQVNQSHTSGTTTYGHFELYRGDSGGTEIFDGQSAELVSGNAAREFGVRWHTHVLDSPATTSATTYTLYYKPESGALHVINRNSSPAIMTLMEISA